MKNWLLNARAEKERRGLTSTPTVDLTGGSCIYKRVSRCGCQGTEYLAVTNLGHLSNIISSWEMMIIKSEMSMMG